MNLSIFDYSDYRQFLRDRFAELKGRNPKLSHRWLARKVEVNSSAFFKMIMDGQRNITKQSLLKVQMAFDLQGAEASYFENLVFFNQAQSLEEKNHYFNKLVTVAKDAQRGVIEPNRYDYFAKWWHGVIRELAVMKDWNQDWAALGAMVRPALKSEQVQESIDLLLRLGFLAKSGKGYVQTEPTLAVGPDLHAIRLVQYQVQMLELVRSSLDHIPSQERMLATTTFGISRETYQQFVKKCRQFRAQLQEIAESDKNPELVYFLHMGFVPLSHSVRDSK